VFVTLRFADPQMMQTIKLPLSVPKPQPVGTTLEFGVQVEVDLSQVIVVAEEPVKIVVPPNPNSRSLMF
jgi:hypothetical protein